MSMIQLTQTGVSLFSFLYKTLVSTLYFSLPLALCLFVSWSLPKVHWFTCNKSCQDQNSHIWIYGPIFKQSNFLLFPCLLSQNSIFLHTARHGQFLFRDEAIPNQSQYAFQRPSLSALIQDFNCNGPDTCFLTAWPLQLSWCSWLHFRDAERVMEVTLQCFSEVVVGWVWVICLWD